MKLIIKNRWKIIFSLLVFLYLSLGVWLYLSELDVKSRQLVCPPELRQSPMLQPIQKPNLELCRLVQPQWDPIQMLFTVFFLPLIIGVITTGVVFIFPIFGLFAFDKLWNFKKYTLAIIPLAAALSIVFLAISLRLPVTVQSPNEFENLQFGLPLQFIEQTQSYSPEYFPYITHFSSVLENPTKVLCLEFGMSFLIIFGITFLILKAVISLLHIDKDNYEQVKVFLINI